MRPKCPICEKRKKGAFSLRGFCNDCILEHGNEECAKIYKDKYQPTQDEEQLVPQKKEGDSS